MCVIKIDLPVTRNQKYNECLEVDVLLFKLFESSSSSAYPVQFVMKIFIWIPCSKIQAGQVINEQTHS